MKVNDRVNSTGPAQPLHHWHWPLALYDAAVYAFSAFFILLIVGSEHQILLRPALMQCAVGAVCIFGVRWLGKVYKQIWRYGGIQCYLRLIAMDTIGFLLWFAVLRVCHWQTITFPRLLSISLLNLVLSETMRMIYRYCYKCGTTNTRWGRLLIKLLKIFGRIDLNQEQPNNSILVAIIGAGRVGVSLAEELLNNPRSAYKPCCFVDADESKVGRSIYNITVLSGDEATLNKLRDLGVQEVVFAIPSLKVERKKALYEKYKAAGFKVKVYDYPVMQTEGSRRSMREFDIEELLFRAPLQVMDNATRAYYRGKVILITGGGGSIGSELCRQLAKMQPEHIIILDIYENGAYDVQQELKLAYRDTLKLDIEICSITNIKALRRVFETYHPQIVINAAAHKHVPLMEHNCIEAVENNVFGCRNLVQVCEEYGAERFLMVSTDKAVNPTSLMGATKRMCEMIIQSQATHGRVKYSATRFGNVLGSAGSVIPLFRRQIMNGGPVTVTDKRIIRYFMTIPEASQLVLVSGAMAHNGELFVLDMGQPVKILDLAENMIRLSGMQGIEIIETGLRPGEKLYEELLINTEGLTRTKNELIFIEKDTPQPPEVIEASLKHLQAACASQNDETVREAMRKAVPTYRRPEDVNREAEARVKGEDFTKAAEAAKTNVKPVTKTDDDVRWI